MTRLRAAAAPVLVVALLAVAANEFARNPNLHHLPWSTLGLTRLAWYAAAFAAIAAFRRPWLAVAAALIYGVAALGPGPFAACAFFCAGAIAAGSLVLADSFEGSACELPLCLCLGEGLLGIAASILGWTRLCYPLTFLLLVLAPIVARWRWLATRARSTLEPGRRGSPGLWLLAFAIGMQFLLALKPEVGTDSLAMHLALPAYVSIHHHFSYDVREFLWAVMPQTTDWCYTLAYSIGGEFAARLLNFTNLLAVVGLLYGFATRHCSRESALLACGLFATGPLTQVVTGSLFVDNLLAALLFGSVIAFIGLLEGGQQRMFSAGLLLLGLALSAKAGAVAFLPGIVALAVVAARARRPGWRLTTASVAGALAIALYFYAIAWRQTGNPVFPYANEIFRSKLIDTVKVASQFRDGLRWRTPIDITFHSGNYIEGSDGAAGFQYFLLLPAGLLVLVWRNERAVRWAAAIGILAFALSFLDISYLRYVYAQSLILMVPIALWLDEQRKRPLGRAFALSVVAAVAMANTLYQPAAGWYHRDFVWNEIWNRGAREEYLRSTAPARIIVDVLNRMAPGEPALFCEFDHIAGFAGPLYTTNWHTLLRHEGLTNLREAIEVLAWVNERKIRHIATPATDVLGAWPRVLPAFFADFAEPVFAPGRWVLYRVRPEFAGPVGLEAARRLADDPPPAGPGQWDDIDVRVVRGGEWFRDFTVYDALDHTLTRSRSAGATLRIPFRGTRISVLYTRDRESGVAEAWVDAGPPVRIDQYAPEAAFGARHEIGGLAGGGHVLTIRVTGDRNPSARDCLVNLDGFVVE